MEQNMPKHCIQSDFGKASRLLRSENAVHCPSIADSECYVPWKENRE